MRDQEIHFPFYATAEGRWAVRTNHSWVAILQHDGQRMFSAEAYAKVIAEYLSTKGAYYALVAEEDNK